MSTSASACSDGVGESEIGGGVPPLGPEAIGVPEPGAKGVDTNGARGVDSDGVSK